MIALSEAYRAGLLSRKHWLPNIVSGLIVYILASLAVRRGFVVLIELNIDW